MHPDQQTYGRAAGAAMMGLIVQFILAVVMVLAGSAAGSSAMTSAALHLFGGLPIWLILLLVYHQHRLERAEALESEQLARADAKTAALFEEHGVDLKIAKRRLDILYKWGLGITTIVVALYLLTVGLLRLSTVNRLAGVGVLLTDARADNSTPAIHMLVGGVIAFVAFIAARYYAGMTKIDQWSLLRGGASYLIGNFVSSLLVGIAFGFAFVNNDNQNGDRVLAGVTVAIPAFMVLLGGEMLLNFLLGMYRPRRPGEMPRPAFDSRLLGLLTSPKSLARAFSDAINYQFGFEVSRSWFYQLLSRAITPLIVIGMLVLEAMSCVVIIHPHEQGVITHYGRIVVDKPLEPGIHFKLPWPIQRAETYPVKRVYQLSVGSSEGLKSDVAILWTNPHTETKEEYLITAPTAEATTGQAESTGAPANAGRTPGMSLIGLQVLVEYQVSDLLKSIRSVDQPWRVLHSTVERQASSYLAGKDIDTLIGPGRIKAGEELRAAIQKDVDDQEMGLQVIFVGLAGVHPPSESNVAQSFHHQIGALQDRQAALEGALREETEALAKVAGSREQGRALSAAIWQLELARQQLDTLKRTGKAEPGVVKAKEAEVKTREDNIELLMMGARGQAASLIYDAHAYKWQRALGEQAKAERFSAEVMAYKAAPALYRSRKYLEVLADGLAKPRKYILTPGTQGPTIRLDLKDAAGLDMLTGTN